MMPDDCSKTVGGGPARYVGYRNMRGRRFSMRHPSRWEMGTLSANDVQFEAVADHPGLRGLVNQTDGQLEDSGIWLFDSDFV